MAELVTAMAEVIAVVSGKGGVGKTTTTANIGTALAYMGKNVLLIDCDIGLRNLDIALGMQNRIVYDFLDIIEDRCDARKAIITDSRFRGLNLLSSPQTRETSSVPIEKMKELIDELKPFFDYIILDCPAGIDDGFNLAISNADKAIVIATPEMISIRDADRIISKLEKIGIMDKFLIINRIRVDMIKKGDMIDIDNMIDIIAIPLLGAVPEDDAVIASNNKGIPVVLKHRTRAGRAYFNIAKRLTGEKVPIMEDEGNIFMRMWRKIFGR